MKAGSKVLYHNIVSEVFYCYRSFAIVPGNLSGLDFSLGKSHCAWKRSCQSAPFQREEAELLVGFAAMVATYWSKKWNGPVAIRRPAAL